MSFVLLTFVVGCTSLAGLDGLNARPTARDEPNVAPSATTQPNAPQGPDGKPMVTADDGTDTDVRPLATDAGRDGSSRKPDAGTLTHCELTGDCACKTKNDCPAGFECCNDRCTDTTSDPRHCNGCSIACPNTKVCVAGDCVCDGLEPDQACVPYTCINFMTDPNHCGTCGHSCLGGECLGQACQPVQIATGQDEPTSIAVDSSFVYFITAGSQSVRKVVKTDLVAPACLGDACAHFESPLFDKPVAIATQLGDTKVYVTNYAGGGEGKVVEVPKSFHAGDERTLATGKGLWSIAMHGGVLYWTARNDPRLVSKFIGGDPASVAVATSTAGDCDVISLALDDTTAYFGVQKPTASMGVGIYRAAMTGSCTDRACTALSTGAGMGKPRAIALNTAYVFWTADDDKVRRMAKGCMVSSASACPVTVLAEGQPDPGSIVADDADVFWANGGDGTVRRSSIYRNCRGVGCQAITPRIASVVRGEQMIQLADDSNAIYVSSRSSGTPKSGTVWRIAK